MPNILRLALPGFFCVGPQLQEAGPAPLIGTITTKGGLRLTEKQQRFCEEYLIDLNATRAAAAKRGVSLADAVVLWRDEEVYATHTM